MNESNDGLFVLFDYVSGVTYERGYIPEGAARSMGLALANLHAALSHLPITKPPYQLPSVDASVDRLTSLLRLAEPHEHKTAVDAYACAKLRYFDHARQRPPTQAFMRALDLGNQDRTPLRNTIFA